MAVKLNISDMECLLQELESLLPRSLMVYGLIKAYKERRWTGLIIWVDKWPEFASLVVRTDPTNVKAQLVKDYVDLFCTDTVSLATMLRRSDIIDWTTELVFRVLEPFLQTVRDVALEHGVLTFPGSGCRMYDVQLEDLPEMAVPKCFRLGMVTDEIAEQISDAWDYRNASSTEYVRACIGAFPSAALYDDADKPVAFVINKNNAELGMLYVLPDYRGRGFGKLVTTVLSRAMLTSGNPAYAHLESDISLKMHEKLGFREIPNCRTHWLECKGLSL